MLFQELADQALVILRESLNNEQISPQVRAEIALKILDLNGFKALENNGDRRPDLNLTTLPIPELYSLSEVWQTWLVENKLRGVSDQSLVDILINQGIAEKAAKQIVFALPQEVSFAYIYPRWRSLQNYQFIAAQYRHQETLTPGKIRRAAQLTPSDFYRNHYAAHVPVLLTELGNAQPWHSQTTFQNKFGDRLISPIPMPPFYPETVTPTASTPQSLAEYFAQPEPAHYVELDLQEWDTEAIAACLKHYDQLSLYLHRAEPPTTANMQLRLQPATAPLRLQAKSENCFVVQLWGNSQWHLASPWQSEFLYGDENWLSPVNLDEPPLERFPKLEQAQIQTLTLKAGEALFIPLLWWHQCRAIAPSGQIICSNFASPDFASPGMTMAK
ncbi:MAG: hypothetical protein HC799_16645 [Limnothrix sp. RL_2_0]|nr:hypothetical protein [Limnothrix sp. RL_2_0]